MKQHEIIYDVEWQALRVSLLGKFASETHIDDNLSKLTSYVGNHNGDHRCLYDRLFRTINLLNAVRMGFHGMDLVDTKLDRKIIFARDSFSLVYKSMTDASFTHSELDWVKTEVDLSQLFIKDRKTFDLIYKDLNKRIKFSIKKTGDTSFRNELTRFVSLMDSVRNNINTKESCYE